MKTDRIQGIIFNPSTDRGRLLSRAAKHSRLARLLKLNGKSNETNAHSSTTDKRYIKVRDDYIELISSDIYERLKKRHDERQSVFTTKNVDK